LGDVRPWRRRFLLRILKESPSPGEGAIKMRTRRHPHSHHVAAHLHNLLHRCNPYA